MADLSADEVKLTTIDDQVDDSIALIAVGELVSFEERLQTLVFMGIAEQQLQDVNYLHERGVDLLSAVEHHVVGAAVLHDQRVQVEHVQIAGIGGLGLPIPLAVHHRRDEPA
jgi:hypothetical protein